MKQFLLLKKKKKGKTTFASICPFYELICSVRLQIY